MVPMELIPIYERAYDTERSQLSSLMLVGNTNNLVNAIICFKDHYILKEVAQVTSRDFTQSYLSIKSQASKLISSGTLGQGISLFITLSNIFCKKYGLLVWHQATRIKCSETKRNSFSKKVNILCSNLKDKKAKDSLKNNILKISMPYPSNTLCMHTT